MPQALVWEISHFFSLFQHFLWNKRFSLCKNISWENLCPNPIWYIYQIKYVQAKKKTDECGPKWNFTFYAWLFIFFIIFLFWTLINVRDHISLMCTSSCTMRTFCSKESAGTMKKNVRFLTQALVAWKYLFLLCIRMVFFVI
jgi:hypothetical protein